MSRLLDPSATQRARQLKRKVVTSDIPHHPRNVARFSKQYSAADASFEMDSSREAENRRRRENRERVSQSVAGILNPKQYRHKDVVHPLCPPKILVQMRNRIVGTVLSIFVSVNKEIDATSSCDC